MSVATLRLSLLEVGVVVFWLSLSFTLTLENPSCTVFDNEESCFSRKLIVSCWLRICVSVAFWRKPWCACSTCLLATRIWVSIWCLVRLVVREAGCVNGLIRTWYSTPRRVYVHVLCSCRLPRVHLVRHWMILPRARCTASASFLR